MSPRPAALTTLVVLSAAPAILLAGVWAYADANVVPATTTTTAPVPPAPAPELATDLLSLRRHPAPLAIADAERREAAAVDEVLGSLADVVDESSCLRIEGADDLLVAHGTDGGVIPASNQKLVIAAVALDVLGSDHRFRTEVVSPRPVDGVVPGSIYLVGGGDPVLQTDGFVDPLRYPAINTTSLDVLADQVVAAGVQRIEGDVVGDGSRYDDEFRVPSWADDITNRDAGPYDALLVDDGVIGDGNYGLNPNRSAARAFADLLIARGVDVVGSAANGPRPDGDFTTVALVESAPLPDILVELLHTSDNNTSEMLVKEIGVALRGEGSRPAGLAAVRDVLAGWGVPLEGVELQDGSGLSRDNRLTCAALTAILQSSPVNDELRSVLPAAGRDGTLVDTLLDTPAEGALVAKTGTLTGVKALSGTQPGADRELIDFAFVLNGEGVDDPVVFEPLWQRLVEAIDQIPITIEPDDTPFAPIPAAVGDGGG